ncbi:MAG TPA: 5'/3'-nucleotidase SurE [Streptosporangiaceae bacterium]|jgi:5'-nucleotidase
MPSASPPHAITTNDDGIDSEGLWHLAAAAAAAGLDVVVAAPAGEASGSGSAIKASQDNGRVEIKRRELPAPARPVPAYAIRATPAFIVFAAVRGAFGGRPRYVLSGINRGPNTGRAVLHSGTVAAAMTAAGYGLAAVAFSLDVHENTGRPEWESAAAVAAEVLPVLPNVPGGVVLNVNVPNIPAARLRGIRSARLASFGAVQAIVPSAADGYLQVNVSDKREEPEPGSDSAALAAGYASVTPLRSVCEVAADRLPWQPVPTPA